jgi:hypothetical protein
LDNRNLETHRNGTESRKHLSSSVIDTDVELGADYATIWLLTLDTGEHRELTAGLARDAKPHMVARRQKHRISEASSTNTAWNSR